MASLPNHDHNFDYKREGAIQALRKSFGDAPDSPTLGYYRELSTEVLRTVTNKAVGLNNRLMGEGIAIVGSAYGSVGFLAAGFKGAAVGLAVAGGALVVDAVRTHRASERLKQDIFDHKV